MNTNDLPREMDPPPGLEARTLAALEREGLIIRTAKARLWQTLAAAAALVVAFGAGWVARGQEQGMGTAPRYALLLYGEPQDGSEADRVAEYRAWARQLAASGHHVSGEKLSDAAEVLGAPAAGVQALRGFFIIDAASDADARAIAAAHPHVRHGGSVVVRRILPT